MGVRIRVIDGPRAGQTFVFEERSTLLIGGAAEAGLRLAEDPAVDAYHGVLEVSPPRVMLRDLSSAGGSYVNGASERVKEVELADGDQVTIGQTLLDVLVDDDAASVTDSTLAEALAPAQSAGAPERAASQAAASRRASGRVAVQCDRCGEDGAERLSPAEAEAAVYFCPGCREAMAKEPVVLPGYRVVRRLGQGAMGVVDLAYDEQGRPRALKRMHPQVALSERNRTLFLREANSLAHVRHPNIVELVDLREHPRGVFVAVLEYVEGQNADQLRERMPGQRLPPALAIDLVAQALEGLSYMHERGVVHRDLKEENLLVRTGPGGSIDTVKITDFGLAKSYEQTGVSGLTKGGEVAGTVPYMAPEQIHRYRDVKPPADLYSMGATLYRLLTGQFAYDFSTERHPLAVVLMEPIVPLRQRDPSLSEALARVVEAALAKNADERFASARAMRQALLAAR